MSKKHEINVTCVDGVLNGTITIHHGSLKVGNTQLATDLGWDCNVTGETLDTLLYEAARNIAVRMAVIRDLPEAASKINDLRGATVDYTDISTWTTKGTKGRKKVADMSVDELMKMLTPAQLAALKARI
jgi:hypothetical protein